MIERIKKWWNEINTFPEEDQSYVIRTPSPEYIALERENAELKAENLRLSSENQKLKKALDSFRKYYEQENTQIQMDG